MYVEYLDSRAAVSCLFNNNGIYGLHSQRVETTLLAINYGCKMSYVSQFIELMRCIDFVVRGRMAHWNGRGEEMIPPAYS